jgi:hypothetical protein
MKLLTILFLCICTYGAIAQNLQRDALQLKNGNTIIGKVFYADSTHIKLKRNDHSIEKFEWAAIETIKGHSYKTWFISTQIGFNSQKYWSTFFYNYQHANGLAIAIKAGQLRHGIWANAILLNLNTGKPWGITKIGVQKSIYLPLPYYKNQCIYAGAQTYLNMINKNKLFFQIGMHGGLEYNTPAQIRFVTEWQLNRSIVNIYRGWSASITFGMRYNIEYQRFYNYLNKNHTLLWSN